MRSTAYFNRCPYIFDILLYYYICLCTTFLWPLRFGWLLVLSLYKEDYSQIFKCVSFWLHGSWVTAVTPTDRPKSVRNRCIIIKVFGGVFCVSTLLFGLFCGCRDWVRSLPFSLKYAYVFLFQSILRSVTFCSMYHYTSMHMYICRHVSDARAIVYIVQIYFAEFCRGQSIIEAKHA